jgi:hypothetical protein
MEKQSHQYYITRTCKTCGDKEDIFLTKKQKAFELYDFGKIWNQNCKICNSSECLSVSSIPIELDKELLLEWSYDNNIHLMPQDEELLIADEKYIKLILDIIDNYEILETKRKILFEALCIIIYDNIIDNSDIEIKKDTELIERVTKELIKRKILLLKADEWIPDYIKKVFFPELGLKLNDIIQNDEYQRI